MDDREMITVGGVLELDLPVAPELEPVRAENLDGVTATLLEESVHPEFGIAQEFLERRSIVIERGEHHARVRLGPQLLQAHAFLAHDVFVTVGVRNAA